MTQLLIENLEDDVRDRLKDRARGRGHSLEEEVRDILRTVVGRSPADEGKLGTRIASRFASVGLDHDIPELRGGLIEPPDFDL